jgi:hypothetical protein
VDFEPAISQKEVWYAFEYEEDVRRTRDSDGRCAEDGVVIPLESLIKDSAASDGVLESLTVTPTSLDAIVLARDAVVLTPPCDFTFKTKAGAFSSKAEPG